MKFETATDGGIVAFELKYEDGASGDIPLKLGDGNFGMVFAGENLQNNLALKIIYKHQVDSEENRGTSLVDHRTTRVMDELQVSSNIAKALREKAKSDPVFEGLLGSYQDHLVLPMAYTTDILSERVIEDVDERRAFENALAELEKRDIYFSTYAYVMHRYNCSLKDLVEETSSEGTESTSGYLRLQGSTVADRERSALHVCLGVAKGLKVLHAANLRHQDIKPANIYYREVGGKVDFRLGDLGFLRPRHPVLAGSAMVSALDLAIGTKHYRSVEQIDYADTCEVDVTVNRDSNTAQLITHDPKFMRTNIYINDLAYFPRSKTQRLFKVTNIEFEEKSFTTKTTIALPPDNDKNPGVNTVFDDLNTQVSFVKNPSSKTDLFGLGAILFDVITAGDSPERFYELLRKFDVKSSTIDETLITYYSLWQADQHINPEISAVFHRICGDSKSNGLSEAVVSFLLRCCMSEPKDSFFREFSSADDNDFQHGWDYVIKELNTLIDTTGAGDHADASINCLTGAGEKNILRPSGSLTVLGHLQKIKNSLMLDGSDHQAEKSDADDNTILKNIVAVKRIGDRAIMLLNDVSEKDDAKYVSFAPEHLSFSADYSAVNNSEMFGKLDENKFYEKLRKNDVHLCALTPFRDRLKPIWWSNRRRYVQVFKGKKEGVSAFRFEYLDFSPTWQGVAEGDYLIVGRGSKCTVFIIRATGPGNNLSCHLADTDASAKADWNDEEGRHGYLVKKIDQIDYTAGMLSIYIFHLLFYRPGQGGVSDYGPSVNTRTSSYPCSGLALPTTTIGNKSEDTSNAPLKKLFGKLRSGNIEVSPERASLNLAVWLMLGGYHSVESGQSNEERVLSITRQLTSWFAICASSIDESPDSFALLSIDPARPIVPINTAKVNEVAEKFRLSQNDWDHLSGAYIA